MIAELAQFGRGLVPLAAGLLMKLSIASVAALAAAAIAGRRKPALAFAFVTAALILGMAAAFVNLRMPSADGAGANPFVLTISDRALPTAEPTIAGVAKPAPTSGSASVASGSASGSANGETAAVSGLRPFDWIGLFGFVWLAGVALVTIRRVVGAAALRAELASARPCGARRAELAAAKPCGARRVLKAAKTFGIDPRALLVSKRARVPHTAGCLRQRIVLPASCRSWSDGRIAGTLLHERAHVARHDNLFAEAARVAASLAWMSPFAWLARAKAVALREAACDEAALRWGIEPKAYALGLLETARSLSPAGAPSCAAAMAARHGLEKRIRAVLRWPEVAARPFPRLRGASAACVLAAAIFASAFVGTSYAALAGTSWVASSGAARGTFAVRDSGDAVVVALDWNGRRFETTLPGASLPVLMPLSPRSRLAAPFGAAYDPKTKKRYFNEGWDLMDGPTVPVTAAAPGTVVARRDDPAAGTVLEIDHGSGIRTRYAFGPHGVVSAKAGRNVSAGEILGTFGAVVLAEMPSLHYEVLMDAGGTRVALDPAAFVFRSSANKSAPIAASAVNSSVRANDRDHLRRLIDLGVDLNVKASDGTLPLEWTVLLGNADLARLLVAAGADPDAYTASGLAEHIANSGPTVLSLARALGNQELVDALKK